MSQRSDLSASSTTTLTLSPADRHEVLYFAYGSNMSTAQMLRRCPSSVPCGLAYLPGWKWFINERGYANIVEVDAELPGLADDEPETMSSTDYTDASGDNKGKGKETAPPSSAEDHHPDTSKVITKGGVYGLLYLLPPDDEARLDRYEGVPSAYQKEILEVEMVPPGPLTEMVRVQVVKALVYVDRHCVDEDDPREEYVDRINRGVEEARREWGLPEWYVHMVVRRFIPGDEEMADVEEEDEDEDVEM